MNNAASPMLFPEWENEPQLTKRRAINVASVPQRSPFRYPGGKTWFVPTARQWFSQAQCDAHLIEPFAGGGIIGLTAIAEGYFKRVTMVEMDSDVAAVWQTMLSNDCHWLMNQISTFSMSPENINQAINQASKGTKELAFATIIRNRTNHGGILAKGSGMIKNGENGRGLSSRWYPNTLIKRIAEVYKMREQITFIHGNAFDIMNKYANDKHVFFFIDPPYTIAGRRLYKHYDVNHRQIFEIITQSQGQFLLTYDDTQEIRQWANEFKLPCTTIPMQTTHLITKNELLISNNFDWLT